MSAQIEDIKKERERFVAFAFAAAEIFLELDENGIILFEGGASNKIGKSNGNKGLIGTPISELIVEDDLLVFEALKGHLAHKGRIGPIPVRFHSDTNKDYAFRLFALHMPGQNIRTFLSLRSAPLGGGSIDPDMQSETGLLTKEHFIDIASKTMSHNNGGGQLYLTAIDVAGLEKAKKDFGPRFLKSLMKRISAHLKSLALDGEIAGQIGEKQFAFLHRSHGDGAHVTEGVQKADPNVKLTTETTTISADGSDIEEAQLLRTLSYVLNAFCENTEKANFDSFSEAYDELVADAQQRVTSIRSMISSGAFKMAFQPVVELKTGRLHHNEILSRFDGDDQAYSPLETIRFAEDVGMIEEFDIALCEKAIDYIRKMRRLGDSVNLAINISGRTLSNPAYIGQMAKLLASAKDVARSLLIELTETSEVSELEQVEALFNDLKSYGYKLCLDEFGSGAAGYQYLRAFNVDYVKISGSYIKDMAKPDYKPTFLSSIVNLCNDLGIKTIGEHVETQFQADLLKSLGVDFAQGFHYGKPDYTPRLDP